MDVTTRQFGGIMRMESMARGIKTQLGNTRYNLLVRSRERSGDIKLSKNRAT
jgi:hypothetical protein